MSQVISLFLILLVAAQAQPVQLAPSTATPPDVVDRMLSLARVTPSDVVYDLGCGDGRIVIAAAQKFGARGVGIEIDPDLVSQARRDAERAGVADRVRFEAADLFSAPLGDATVVTLYLSPELNARLRPRLLAELSPGARIVSHQFPMADWPPTQTVRLNIDGREHVLHLWVVPPRAP